MKMFQLMKILVPVDLSEMSLDVLQYAVGLAGEGTEVHVLHVAEERNYVGEFVSSEISLSRIKEDTRIALESELEILANKVSTPAKVKITIVWGVPVNNITQFAESGNFDLIVMATHSRRGLNRLFVGSVTEAVMRRAPCSVLALRAKTGEAEQIEKEKETAAAI